MNDRKVAILGAGLSGRGMLGEMFYKDNYKILFVDIDEKLTEGLNQQKYYHVKMTNLVSKISQVTKVDSFEILNVRKERREVVEKLSEYNLICTALKPDGFDEAIDYLIDVIRLRKSRNVKSILKVTLGANYVGLYEYYDQRFRQKLKDDEIMYYEKYVVLIMSIINRKNLKPIVEEDILDPYSIIGDDKPVLRVENVEELRNMSNLPSFFRLENNLSAAMAIKIWSGNVVQCSMAFVALEKGLQNSREAAYDQDASRLAYHAAKEAYYGVFQEYHVEENNIDDRAKKAVSVFRNDKFADDLYRIAREPIRKISYNDRFIGPALLCLKYDKIPYFISKCLAYGFVMKMENEPDCDEIQKSINNIGIRNTIIKYCGLDSDKKDERILIDLIECSWRDIKKGSF